MSMDFQECPNCGEKDDWTQKCFHCGTEWTDNRIDNLIRENKKLKELAREIIQADKCNIFDNVSQKVEALAVEAREILKFGDITTEGNKNEK